MPDLVTYAVSRINSIPMYNKKTSPVVEFRERTLNADKLFQFKFGDFVVAFNSDIASNDPLSGRGLPCIVLFPETIFMTHGYY